MSGDPIERYLDALFVALRTSDPRGARALLSETEAHLHDLAAEGERNGLDTAAAGQRAVDMYCDPAVIAAADRQRVTTPMLVRVGLSAWQLGAAGAIAIGMSGVIAGIVHLLGASDTTLAPATVGANLAASDCARWRALYPTATSCAQAALRDWTAETIYYRIAVGLLGLVALGTLMVIRRRSWRARAARPLPRTVSDSIAAAAFGVAAVWLTGLGIDSIVVRSGAGAGAWLTAAPVALIAAAFYGRRLLHDISTASLAS